MKRETLRAIQYFEDAVREADEIIAQADGAERDELSRQRRHFYVALRAMRRTAGAQPRALTSMDAKDWLDRLLDKAMRGGGMDTELADALSKVFIALKQDECEREWRRHERARERGYI